MDKINIRASSLSELFDCPARWEAKHIDKLTLPASGAAWVGTSLHRSTAAFDQAFLDASPISAIDASGVFVDSLYHPDCDVAWGEDKPEKVENIGRTLNEKYCNDLAPQQTYKGIEVTCEDLDIEFPEHQITLRLTGTTDRIRVLPDGRKGIADMKTGKQAINAQGQAKTTGHGIQMGVYELLAEYASGEPIEAPAQIIGLQTNSKTRVATGEVQATRSAIIGTEDRPGLLEHAARILKSGAFYANPRSMLCSEKFCPIYQICSYRS